MKKIIVLLLFVFGSFGCISQTFTVVLTADSHGQNDPPGGSDSLWINQYVVYLRQFYPSVTLVNLAFGGTYIQQVMPNWFWRSDARLNLNTVLSYNPDLVIISQSGNHTILGITADSNLYCFNYLIDTLKSLGKSFLITGQAPRQKTFTPPVTLTTYYDSSLKINANFLANNPKYWCDPYPLMMDNIRGKYPWTFCLGPDSLHWSNYGSRMYFWTHRDSWVTDSLLNKYKAEANNYSILKSGSNVTLSGNFRYNSIYVKGSNDLVNFTTIQTFTASDETVTELVNQTFPHSGYMYLQVVVYSKYLSKTMLNLITGFELFTLSYTSPTRLADSTAALRTSINAKQATLVNQSTIKSVNGNNLLGSGDLVVSGAGLGYTLSVQALTSSPTDAQTIYFGQLPKAPVTAAATSKIYIRKAGTIKMAQIYCYSGTAEAWVINIRLNNTTDTQIASVSLGASERIFTNSSLNISVVAGDYIEIKAVNPTWATNPLTCIFGGYVYIE